MYINMDIFIKQVPTQRWSIRVGCLFRCVKDFGRSHPGPDDGISQPCSACPSSYNLSVRASCKRCPRADNNW